MIINKELLAELGLEASVMMSALEDLGHYDLIEPSAEWFKATIEEVKELSTLSAYQQRKAIEKLQEAELIECEVRGLPATRQFRFV